MKKTFLIIIVLIISTALLAEDGTVNLNLVSSFADSLAVPAPIDYDFFVIVDSDTLDIHSGTIAPQTTLLQIDYSTPITQETEEEIYHPASLHPNPAKILKYKSGSHPQKSKCLLSRNAKIITKNRIAVYNIKGQKIAEKSSDRNGTLQLDNAFGIYFIQDLDKTVTATSPTRETEFIFEISGSDKTFPMEYLFTNLEQNIMIPRKRQIQIDATGITAANNETPIDSVYVFSTFQDDIYYKKVPNGSLVNIITGDESESFLHKDGYFGLMINSNRETLFPDEVIFPKDTKNFFGKQALAHIPESVLTEPEMRIVNHAAAFGGTRGVSYHFDELIYQVQYQEFIDPNINFDQALEARNGFVETFNRLIKRILGDDNWTENDLYNINQDTCELIYPENAEDTTSPVHYLRLHFLEEDEDFNETDRISICSGSPGYANYGFHPDGCSIGGGASVFF
ncbi:MAG: hypothetical protein U9N34_09135, partial [Candidatus Cloacimonadota bacterium]|nr:hypothetical protein [Candidatus Cloacimonadota bacterium]